MKLIVREANPRREFNPLLQFFRDCLAADCDENRLAWLYFANPHGTARVWVLEDSHGLVGAGAAIPKKLRILGDPAAGCVFGDFCVSPSYRSIGPALQLQRACMQSVDSGWARLAYDLPSASMMAVYRRLGIAGSTSLVRMAKPIRVDRQVQDRLRPRTLAKLVCGVGNVLLKARDRAKAANRDLEIQLHDQACTREFDDLFDRTMPKTGSWCVERSSAYLNWRFREHFKERYSIWTARRKNKLEAYAITQKRDHDVQVTDLFGTGSAGILEILLLHVVESARAEKAMILSLPVLSGHPWQERLEAIGFYRRESNPIVIYGTESATNSAAWLTAGDRDS